MMKNQYNITGTVKSMVTKGRSFSDLSRNRKALATKRRVPIPAE
jgi:hypothetical protein